MKTGAIAALLTAVTCVAHALPAQARSVPTSTLNASTLNAQSPTPSVQSSAPAAPSTPAAPPSTRSAPPSTPPASAAPQLPPVGGDQLGGKGVVQPRGVKAPPKTEAASYLVADAGTGEVLAAKNAHGRFLPASTLKALTALTLIPKLDPARKVKPSTTAINQEGSAVGLVRKQVYTVENLFHGLMLSSGNDAAMALAETNGGLDKTLRDMNTVAHRLQANDTVAKTPSGLDKPGQSSSAYDLALIARAGLRDPSFARYIRTKVSHFPAPKKGYEIANHNKLLWKYKGMVGVKNGWTSKAQGSFIGAATRGNKTIIVTLMRHESSFWEDVSKLLDWGFATDGKVAPVGRLVDPLPDTVNAAGPHAVHSPATAPLLGTASGAGGTLSGGRLAAGVVIGGGLLSGLLWLLYGARRRRARSRL